MKTKLLLTLVSNFVICHLAFGQGALTPPGAPAPTMKTLAQIEPRTPISAAPFTISNSGSYYLTTNVTTAVSNAIVITANGVTLDLSGFTISSTVANAANGGTAILLAGGLRNLTIVNGFIQGGVTNNGSGFYAGSGFVSGIFYSGSAPVNTRVSGVSVAGCLVYGIYLITGNSTVVEACTVRTVGNNGILASTIKGSVAVDCGGTAILGDQVSDCRGESTGSGTGLYAISSALNCYGLSSSSIGLYATTAQNCSGYSSSYYGLYANYTAENCYGYTSGSGSGLYATTAQNCSGYSSGGYGLDVTTAQNCSGGSNTGTGIIATIAQNCYGSSSSGYGLYIGNIATGCTGQSSSATHAGLYCGGTAQACGGYNYGGGYAVQAVLGIGCVKFVGNNNISGVYLGTVSP